MCMAGCSDQRVCALLCGVVAAVAEAVSHVGMYAQASLLCLPEEDSDAGFFDGEPTNFADDYDLGRKLGDGGYSEVFLCVNKKTGDEFAVKIIAKTRLDSSGLRALTEEVRVTRKASAAGWQRGKTWRGAWMPGYGWDTLR